MELAQAIEKLYESNLFKDWNNKNNKDFYLSHAFIMIDPQVKTEWQIGFFNPKNKKIVTFAISETQHITKNPESEPLNNDKEILKLDLSNVKINLKQAIEIAEKKQKEKYSNHTAFKKIVLLQNLELGQVWNITYVTNTFKTLNIKIDSKTGNILSDELFDLFKIEK